MISLRPLTVEEFAMWFDRSTERQAEDRAWGSGRSVVEERAELQRVIPLLLPQGRNTPGHAFCLAENKDGAVVGFLWVGRLPGQPASAAFLFDVFVESAHRRKGHAQAMLVAMLDRLKADGVERFALNVRADNHGARALYERLGFTQKPGSKQDGAIEMFLEPQPPRAT